MKKILLITIILLLNNCAGYKPIFSNKDTNFRIVQINNLNNDMISREITKS